MWLCGGVWVYGWVCEGAGARVGVRVFNACKKGLTPMRLFNARLQQIHKALGQQLLSGHLLQKS